MRTLNLLAGIFVAILVFTLYSYSTPPQGNCLGDVCAQSTKVESSAVCVITIFPMKSDGTGLGAGPIGDPQDCEPCEDCSFSFEGRSCGSWPPTTGDWTFSFPNGGGSGSGGFLMTDTSETECSESDNWPLSWKIVNVGRGETEENQGRCKCGSGG